MIKKATFETIEVAGLNAALRALRLPHNGKPRSEFGGKVNAHYTDEDVSYSFLTYGYVHPKDLELMQRLAKNGDDHSKVLRGVCAWCDITAPRLFWQEFDTYRIGVEKMSSGSTMHTIGKGGLTIDDFDVNDVIRQALTPNEYEVKPIHLHFDTPKTLECKIVEKFGRKYEVWNNGDVFALEFTITETMPSGRTRVRTFPKRKAAIGKTVDYYGYFQVGLGGRKGRAYQMHRLIAECFVPNPNNLPIVNHKDGDKGNCSPSNLEWCTYSENNKHAFDIGLKEWGVRQKYLVFKNGLKYDEDQIYAWKVLHADGWTLDKISKHCGCSISVLQKYIGGGKYQYGSENEADFRIALELERTINQINQLALLYEETKDSSILYDIKSILPESFLQRRVVMLSYQSLRRIAKQRGNHRLPQWHDMISWMHTLPLAEELIFHGLSKENGDPQLPTEK